MRAASAQAPNAVVLIRPHHFRPNPQTAADNAFQRPADHDVSREAYDAVTRVAERLRIEGVRVHLFEDESDRHPDSVFPNNWFSTHAGGRVAVYPMYAPNRRGERRADIVEMLKSEYRVQEVIDYSGLEADDLFLEGTGAMVLDHVSRIAYAVRSRRCDPVLVERFCTVFGYEPVVFDAVDTDGVPIYHTNVMMCIGTDIALIGLDAVVGDERREQIAQRIRDSGRTLVALDAQQVASFAGNAIELRDHHGERMLVMSETAHRSLTDEQLELVSASCRVLPLPVSPIELAGGSVRCMLAGIHLDPR
ncbi:arginine deiminase-related protein [Microbacterium sp. ARD32]|uniref:citrulline utilization hydrolase CtlX n=1 Tax=Microbacterium sp. ARD32 TaxID=2962577 RepID=UPI002881A959|nr:arginine deiminase-related protein [Microbacterium sp. ARD32]MDT0156481.1 arginine deiminase-related protein [Microbacterium sp. ARD32]